MHDTRSPCGSKKSDRSFAHFVAWRLPTTTVQHRDSAEKRCEEKNAGPKRQSHAWPCVLKLPQGNRRIQHAVCSSSLMVTPPFIAQQLVSFACEGAEKGTKIHRTRMVKGRAATTFVRVSSWTQQFSNNFHGRCKNGSVFRFHFRPSESDILVLSGTRGTMFFHMASEAPKIISWPRTTAMYKHKPQQYDNITIL